MNKRKYYPAAVALYITYFLLGISATIVGQYKQEFAAAWGAARLEDGTFEISRVMTVIAAIGLGRLIAFPAAGPFSDRYGRKKSALVGMTFFLIFFAGLPFTTNTAEAYVLLMCAGIGNSFLDTSVTPSCMEIFSEHGAVANLFTKFSVSVGQFLLPILILSIDGLGMTYHTTFFLAAGLVVLDTIAIVLFPFPDRERNTEKAGKKKSKIQLSPALFLLIGIGFTSSATFMIFMNCNQELGILYGLENPQLIQSFYSVGIVTAVLLTSVLVSKGIKPIRILVAYPLVACASLLLMYLVRSPQICLAGGFLIGFFAAGGVLQLTTSTANEMYPEHRGVITAMVMFASAISNYVVINAAGLLTAAGGANGPRLILLFNMLVTFIGILFAIVLNIKYAKDIEK
ncbi:MAG: MFS transporter [Clostridiales bacterium]|nr:MFS transporter [Clostridiales bacterium]